MVRGKGESAITFTFYYNSIFSGSGRSAMIATNRLFPLNQDYGALLPPPILFSPEMANSAGNSDSRDANRADEDKQCRMCLWTGVATCTGLSLFFIKQALLELPESGSKEVMKEAARQKRFLFLCSAASAAAGAYRYHLG